jgi:hypothetical protein
LYIVKSEIFNLNHEMETLYFISNGDDPYPTSATAPHCRNPTTHPQPSGVPPHTTGPFIKPNKQMLEASSKKKKIPYKKGPTFKIKIK